MQKNLLPFVLLATILLVGVPIGAMAARPSPSPLLLQLEEGFGVVAGEVVTATSRPSDQWLYDVNFRVREVTAHPTGAAPFTLDPGATISVPLRVGYGGKIEHASLATGSRYHLVVKRLGENSYEHAGGASAAYAVDEFLDADRKFFAAARALAAVPKAERVGKWLSTVADAGATDRLRSAALSALAQGHSPEDAATVRRRLLEVWNDPVSRHSRDFLSHLDGVLRGYTGFSESADRRNVWLAHLFAATPENLKENHHRDNTASFLLRDFILAHPEQVGPRLVAELSRDAWPEGFRRSIAVALLHAYLRLERPDHEWEPALQSHYARGLRVGSSDAVRSIALAIAGGTRVSGEPYRRRFVPDAKVRAGLREALSRMQEEASRPNADHYPKVVASDLEKALEAVEGK